MSSELEIYKRNKTNELRNNYNLNISRLNSALSNNIRNI